MRNYLIIFFLILFIIPVVFKNISATDYEIADALDGFGWSMGLSLDGDRVYVSDGLYNKILVFDTLENIFLERISLEEKLCVGHIHGVEIMTEKIFVVKENQNCIAVFDLTGEFLYEFGKKGNGQGEFDGPFDIEIYQENIFITDSNNNRIQVFDLTGEFLYEFGKKGNGQGEFDGPFDIEIYQENIFITDSNNNRIQVFDLTGEFLYEFGKKGNGQGEFDGSLGIKIYKNKIFVTDSGNNRIQVFDLTGEFADIIDENFNNPHQISLSENKIYVLDTYNYQVKIFSNQNQVEYEEDMLETNDFSLTLIIILMIITIIGLFMIFLRKKLAL